MVLLAVFAFGLGWFPSGGATAPGAVFPSEWARLFSMDFARHLVLPAVTLAIYLLGLPVLLMRSNMIEVMGEEFVTMARMKGLPEWSIMLRHAARNALLPLVTAFALGLGTSIGGNVVIEMVFSWPGLGRMLVDAVSNSDYPLAQGAFLLIARGAGADELRRRHPLRPARPKGGAWTALARPPRHPGAAAAETARGGCGGCCRTRSA